MDFMEILAGAFVFIAIFSVVFQLGLAYALQTLADKNDLSSLARFLAWVPLANLYPMIEVAGLSFKKFVLGAIGFVVGLVGIGMAAGFAGEGAGAIVSAGGMFVMVVGAAAYVGLMMWKTAERRGLPGFIGLLTLIPFFGLFAYGYIAFHDGFAPLNKAGFALGLFLAVSPMIGQYQMMQTMGDAMGQMEMTESGTIELTPGSMEATMGDAGAAMELTVALASAQALDPTVPEQAETLGSTIVESKRKLAGLESTLGPEATADLRAQIAELEMKLQTGLAGGEPNAAPSAHAANTPTMGIPAEATGNADEVIWALDAGSAVAVTSSVAFDEMRGFEVPADVACPEGSQLRGGVPPEAFEQWCERDGLKHGWYTSWHDTGMRKAAGEYDGGMRIGVWTRWFPDGIKRVQAEFEAGMQQGRLIAWDRSGAKVRELQFAQGQPASR